MQLSKNVLALSVALISLTGCGTFLENLKTDNKEEVLEVVVNTPPPRVETKPERTNRDLTLTWDNIGRAGAAMHQPGYVHVLSSDGLVSFQSNDAAVKRGGSGRDNMYALNQLRQGSNKSRGYSMYELSRWERYCDSGKGMDERDWRFVKGEGYDNAPLDVLGGVCLRPTHRYEDYMTAWVRFCTSSPELNQTDRRIVGNSTRPFSKVSPCQALLK